MNTVTNYLLSSLSELGVKHVFGVPGDYNMPMLDFVEQREDMEWVGTANELNAAYAADGYARIKGIGAVVTTYGVGELSAINAIAGAYAESVPVVHIVGGPKTAAERARANVHHTLGDGDFRRFTRVAAEVTVAQAYLTEQNALEEIDRVLQAAQQFRKPVYIVVPKDVAVAAVTVQPKKTELATNNFVELANLGAFVKRARAILANARTISVVVGHLVDRFDARAELGRLVPDANAGVAVLVSAKGIVDESLPNFLGLYAGALSDVRTRQAVEEADVIITAGVVLTDGTTGGFTHRLALERRIDVGAQVANIAGTAYEGVPLSESLAALSQILREHAA